MKRFIFSYGLAKVEVIAKNEVEARSKLKIDQRQLSLIKTEGVK